MGSRSLWHSRELDHQKRVINGIPLSKSGVGYILCNACRITGCNLWFDARAKESFFYSIDTILDSPERALPTNVRTIPCVTDFVWKSPYTKHFLCRVRRVSSPACECGQSGEDMGYLVLHCTGFAIQRDEPRRPPQARARRAISLSEVLGPRADGRVAETCLQCSAQLFD